MRRKCSLTSSESLDCSQGSWRAGLFVKMNRFDLKVLERGQQQSLTETLNMLKAAWKFLTEVLGQKSQECNSVDYIIPGINLELRGKL